MELYVLDVEGTQEQISLNSETEESIKKDLDDLDVILVNTELGIETSISKINDSYITTKSNATWYKEINPNWIFSKVTIMEL